MNRDGQSIDQIGENTGNPATQILGKPVGNKKLIKNNAKASTRSDQSLETSAQNLAAKEDSSGSSATNPDYIPNSAGNSLENIGSLSGGKSDNQLLEPAAAGMTGIPNFDLGSNQGEISSGDTQLGISGAVQTGAVQMGPSGAAGTAQIVLAGATEIGIAGALNDREICIVKNE